MTSESTNEHAEASVEPLTIEPADESPTTSSGLGRRALINSAQLTAAMMLSWVVSLAGRFLLPHVLGTEQYGQLAFVESVAVLSLSLMAFGVAGYIRREVTARPEHALEFARPLSRVQFASGIAITAAMTVAFAVTSGRELATVALAFGLAQVAIVLGQMNAAYLHARHEVRVVSVSAIATKLAWFILLLAILGAGYELLALPLALLVSETARTTWIHRAVRKSYGRPAAAPPSVAFRIIRKSTPFYVNALNVTLLGYSVRIMIGVMASADAVAFTTAAELATSVALLVSPIVTWLAVPTFTALRERGADILWLRVGQVIDLLAVPVCAVGVALFALSDELMPLAFGEDFAPAGPAFAFLALSVPATYFTQTIGCAFIADDRTWQNTKVNLYTMLLVVFGVFGALLWLGTDDAGTVAMIAAALTAFGEWVTVGALVAVRPFGGFRRTTVVRTGVLMAVLVLSAVEKLNDDLTSVRFLAATLAVVIGLTALPRLLRQGRLVLQTRGPSPDPTSSSSQ